MASRNPPLLVLALGLDSPSASDEYDRVWILDVDGAPLVIDAFSSPGASDGVVAELQQIVESIQIEP